MDIASMRIVVTGGAGFLGQQVVHLLKQHGCTKVYVPRSTQFDLRKEADIIAMFHAWKPEMVIHLAAVVGGIGANLRNPGSFLYDNLMMGTQLLEQSRLHHIEKFVAIGTICSYPKHASIPFKETDLWNGYPEESNAPYGLAKKMMLVQAQAYRQQYGLNGIYLLPVNMYGPGDNFDLQSSHVIPAIIRKCIEARERGDAEVTLWGTGNATREFLYVEDAAEAIVLASLHYEGAEPVNIGTGQEIRIRDLAEWIKVLTGYTGIITWNTDMPDGQPRRCLDTSMAETRFQFKARTSLLTGLEQTISWYTNHRSTS
ncbi:GDP-L-fucose synthase family protein [Paenibacillus sp. 481]|uniref:GDP-L-fucose synthase family protein n=1 Tax=Paenibacillus sp. 481 TaxID=2835869 RepID=UPI001E2E0613|nr:GDP-L-fucose synthase [Paenibacillus sp. 481]UHA73155.1 GDP-L-fucose synthase [Paenibacillus sp. 481]